MLGNTVFSAGWLLEERGLWSIPEGIMYTERKCRGLRMEMENIGIDPQTNGINSAQYRKIAPSIEKLNVILLNS